LNSSALALGVSIVWDLSKEKPMEAPMSIHRFSDYVWLDYEEALSTFGLDDPICDSSREFWLGHSLPPHLSARRGDPRVNRKEQARRREVEAKSNADLILGNDTGFASIHRKLNDLVEFAATSEADSTEDFMEGLTAYLARDVFTLNGDFDYE
jgi:hypothetical protein